MQSWIELDRGALRHNFRSFTAITGENKLIPVVKANAYGHGLEEVYKALDPEKPAWLAVAYLGEAKRLRDLGYGGRILLVTPLYGDDLSEAAQLKTEVFIGDQRALDQWCKANRKPPCHVKFDTGLSRQGFFPDEAAGVVTALATHRDLVAGICTHFANVEDVLEHEFATLQMSRFAAAVQTFSDHGLKPLKHCASSASCLLLPQSRLDLSRVGISMYGLWPSPATRLSYLQLNAKIVELQPVLSWRTRIASIKLIKAGDYVGYGCTYRAMTDLKIAVLPLGYNEGYLRLCGSDQSYVLVRGKRCPLVGRISMNLMTINVNHVAGAAPGDIVTLIGRDHEEYLDAATVAGWANTIPYEFLTRLHPQLPRKAVS